MRGDRGLTEGIAGEGQIEEATIHFKPRRHSRSGRESVTAMVPLISSYKRQI